MLISELIYKEETVSYCEDASFAIDNISTSIFNLEKNFLYIAERRGSFDIEKTAAALQTRTDGIVVCDTELKIDYPKSRIIRVKNLRRICAFIFARYHKISFEKIRFIGITGTNGKSSTALMIEHILLESGKRVGLIGTGKIKINGAEINDSFYSMTTPDPDLLYKSISSMQREGCEYIVMEVSSHALFFEKTAPIFFDIAVFTNMSREHSDFHNGMEDYFACKLKLFLRAEKGVFNTDDEYSKIAYHAFEKEKHSVAIYESGDAMAKEPKLTKLNESEYVYREKGLIFKVKLNLGGIYNVYNSLMAIKVSLLLGLDAIDIKNALFTLKSIEGRNEIISIKPTVIIDYAHTPVAIQNELFFLKSRLLSGQKLIVVFGCGGERDRKKRADMARIAEKYADTVIITQDNSRSEERTQIFKDILSGISNRKKARIITERKKAIIYAINSATKNDVIAVIGKGHERYNIDKKGKHCFDERLIIRQELERLGL